MTNEKRYQAIVEMLRAYDMATGNGGAENVLRNPDQWISCKFQPFYAAAAEMVIDLRTSMDSKKSSKVSIPALKRILKDVKNDLRMGGIITCETSSNEKRYALLDGHRILLSKIDYDSIPHVDPEKTFKPTTILKMVEDTKNNVIGDPVALPTVTELKNIIAESKAKKSDSLDPFKVCDGLYVNPQYLLDFIQAMPECKAYKTGNKASSPLWFECETSEGVLLPVRHAA